MSGEELFAAGREPWWQTTLASLIAIALAVGFIYYLSFVLVPVHGGVDQNGYLVGGKQVAATGTMKLRPTLPGSSEIDPHQLVGRMWVGAGLGSEHERYYPKYPIGLPLLYAIALLAGGTAHGVEWAYWISPVAMTIAAWMTFQLGRRFTGSIGGLMAMLLFITAPVTLALATNPNSHAAAVCCVVSGMYFLFTWLQRGGGWRALLAGLCCGYAVTIRYTEGALLLPLGLAGLFVLWSWRPQRRERIETPASLPDASTALQTPDESSTIEPAENDGPRSRRAVGTERKQVLLLGLGWLVPVAGLVIYNLIAMGAVTGYDPTNESIGFSLDYAIDNWETMLRQLATSGLFFVLPLSVAGLAAMVFWNWRWALIVIAWVLPCIVVYTFYYWAPDGTTVGYVRFFMTIVPALCVAAVWTCRAVTVVAAERGYRAAALFPVAIILAIATCAQLQQGLSLVESDFAGRLTLQGNTDSITKHVPDDATLFCSDQPMLHHLQLVRSGPLYHGETFGRAFVVNLTNSLDMDEPQGLDPARRAAMFDRLGDFGQGRLDDEQRRVVQASLDAGRRVFYVAPLREGTGLPRKADDPIAQRQFPEILKRRQKAGTFAVAVRASWNVPMMRPAQDRATPRARRGDFRPDRRQGYWQVIEVSKPAPPATTQSRRPATKPATTRRP